jgi:hypothetical protein
VEGLIAQMISWPQRTVKVVRDLAFGHTVPTKATPFVGGTGAAGYDGPGDCSHGPWSHLDAPYYISLAMIHTK